MKHCDEPVGLCECPNFLDGRCACYVHSDADGLYVDCRCRPPMVAEAGDDAVAELDRIQALADWYEIQRNVRRSNMKNLIGKVAVVLASTAVVGSSFAYLGYVTYEHPLLLVVWIVTIVCTIAVVS